VYANIITNLLDSAATLIGSILTFYYELVPHYGAAIMMLTATVMLAVLPLNLKAMRSQLAMASLAPELKKLKEKYPNPADRQAMNVEMMAIYKENKVSPLAGCLPMFLQIPIFLALYRTISGLTTPGHGSGPLAVCDFTPRFVGENTRLYQDLVSHREIITDFNGTCPAGTEPYRITMRWIGIDLADRFSNVIKVSGFGKAWPYLALVVLMVSLQYFQQWQMMRRTPQTAQNKAMIVVMKVMPLMFGIISINFPAALVLYWATQSVFRILQQSATYKFDPVVKKHMAERWKQAGQDPNATAKSKARAAAKTEAKSGSGSSGKSGSGGKATGSKKGAVVVDTRPDAEKPKGAPTPKRTTTRRAQGGRK
jgi:YidC/Oxa1 family membrane protein insertase